MSFERLYRENNPSHIIISEDIRAAIQVQVRDNQGAMYAAVQALSLQTRSHAIDVRNLLALLVEMPIPTSTIIDNFSITTEDLMSIRSADPITIVSCLECRTHLPDSDRRTFLRQVSTLKYLERFEVGDPVDEEKLYTLLCEGCAQGVRHLRHEQARAERLARHHRKAQLQKMPYPEYLLTPEWKVLRNRALIRAGNRCQLDARHKGPFNVHHNNSYDRCYGDELLEDLVVLCKECHNLHHGVNPEAA